MIEKVDNGKTVTRLNIFFQFISLKLQGNCAYCTQSNPYHDINIFEIMKTNFLQILLKYYFYMTACHFNHILMLFNFVPEHLFYNRRTYSYFSVLVLTKLAKKSSGKCMKVYGIRKKC